MAAPAEEVFSGNGVTIHKWKLTTADSVGDVLDLPNRGDATVQAYGDPDFGGGTVSLDLSNIPDPRISKWFAAKDHSRTDIALAADGGAEIIQRCRKMRPKLTGSTGAQVQVYLLIG